MRPLSDDEVTALWPLVVLRAAWYVVVACLVPWTPGATAWYRWRDDQPRHPLG